MVSARALRVRYDLQCVMIAANRIHLSQTTYKILAKAGKYILQRRGLLVIKASNHLNNGAIKTFFLSLVPRAKVK